MCKFSLAIYIVYIIIIIYVQVCDCLSGDMVEAWLKQKDDVFNESGEPTVTSLTEALKKINKVDLAERIIKGNQCYKI